MTQRNSALQRGFPLRASTRDAIIIGSNFIIGAAGAVSVQLGDVGVALEKTGTGTYKFTFPKLNAEQIKRSRFLIQVISPLLTIVGAVITDAGSLGNGELTFKSVNAAGAATDPDVLDAFMISFWTTSSGTRQ